MPAYPARLLAVCLVVLTSTACTKTEEAPPPVKATPPPAATAPTPPSLCSAAIKDCTGKSVCVTAPITSAQAAIPDNPCTFQGEGSPLTQSFVDVYSWNAFLGVNWPASTANCSADTSKSILNVRSGDGSYVVWQTWMPGENVFVNPGWQKPAAWCSGNSLAAGAQRVMANEAKAKPIAKKLGGAFLKISEPGGDVLQASGDVVTDQSQRWLRYERIMNQTEYNYIVADRWNAPQLAALKKGGQNIVIPPRSIEIKSAWKVLTPAEIATNSYFTTQAIVCNTPDGARTPCNDKPVTLGLVGLHIVQQVTQNGTMFWSTFEHNANDTVFYNPSSNAAPNTDFAKAPYTELDASCKGVNMPTQIKRITPVPASPDVNRYYQQLLGKSVFANYRLISTQWTTGVGVTRVGTPPNVANITLETYVQDNVSNSGPSKGATGCFSCHYSSQTIIPNQDGGHSFFFIEAQYATMKPKS